MALLQKMNPGKMNIRNIIILSILLSCSGTITAQESYKPKKFEFSGHLETLEMVWIKKFDSTWQTMNTIYNRLNFSWFPNKSLTFRAGMRNLVDYGQIVTMVNLLSKYYPNQQDYEKLVVKDAGFFGLTRAWSSGDSYVFYSNIDRINLQYTRGKFEATLGRQRINWGINLVWNPNDIFNTFNYFNFDYIERPGCDALRLQYYTGMTSSAQLAIKIDHEENITFAGMYKFTNWKYDIQLLGGKMNDDYVVGAGWSGQIEKAGFNGEFSYFHSQENFSDTAGILVASFGINYTFKNSLYLQGSALYNSNGTTGKASRGNMFAMDLDVSPKNLSLARYSLFGQASYPITPLINASFAGIWNPNDKSGFLGPSVDFSLKENLSFLVTAQVFMGGKGTEFGDYGKLAYMRLKWSF